MKRKIISLFTCLIMLVNVLFSAGIVTVSASEISQGVVIFKFYDVEEERYLYDGENVAIGKYYDLEVWVKDVEWAAAGQAAFYFNPNVLQVVSSDMNEEIPSEIKGDTVLGEYNAIVLSENPNGWQPRFLGSNNIVGVSNTKGLVYAQIVEKNYIVGGSLAAETRMLSVRMKVSGRGSMNIRIGTFDDEKAFYMTYVDDVFLPTTYIIDSKQVVSPVSGVDIEEDSIEIGVGNSYKLNYTVLPAEAYNKNVTWTSEDTSVATVDQNGNVLGKAVGETNIIITTEDGGFIDTCSVSVINPNLPTTPKNLKVAGRTGKRIELEWTKSTCSNGDISGYWVYRDGEKIAETTKCEYTDLEVDADKEYIYTVCAYNEVNDNKLFSSQSDELKASAVYPKITNVVPQSQEVMGASTDISCYVYYENSNNASGTTLKVEFLNDSNEWQTVNVNASSGVTSDKTQNYFSFSLSPQNIGVGQIRYTVADKDDCTDSKAVRYILVQNPNKVNGLVATPTSTSIILSWERSNSAYTTQYVIYRKKTSESRWSRLKYINSKDTTSYIDSSVTLKTSYDYYIIAVDKFGQTGADSEIATAMTTNDDEAPNVISISPTSGMVISGVTEIDVSISDNIRPKDAKLEYRLKDNDTWKALSDKVEIVNGKVSFNLDTRAFNDGSIQIHVIAWDYDGNQSDGYPVRSYTIDNTAPAKILTLTGNADSPNKITLLWDGYVVEDDLYYYVVEQKNANGTYTKVAGPLYDIEVKGVQLKNLAADTSYTYRVIAYDRAQNASEPSNDFTISTSSDEEPPVVIDISPKPKRINKDLNISFTVKDNCAVSYADIEVSRDGETWEYIDSIYAVAYDKTETLYYTLKVADYSDGIIYVRAIAYDEAYNGFDDDYAASVQKSVPYNQYYIDTTPPAAPKNLTTQNADNYIQVKWDANTEEDFAYYVLMRAESEDGAYRIVADGLTNLNYYDRTVNKDTTYYYKLYCLDVLGNRSEFSNIVSTRIADDITPPVIEGLLPSNGARIRSNESVSIFVNDTGGVEKAVLEYSIDGVNWAKVGEGTKDISSVTLENAGLQEGKYKFRAYAIDKANNRSAYSEVYEYTIDDTPPEITNVKTNPGRKSITVSCNCTPYSDLRGVIFYYRRQGETAFVQAATRAPSASNEYSCNILGLADDAYYEIKIEALDNAGNTGTYVTNLVYVEKYTPAQNPDNPSNYDEEIVVQPIPPQIAIDSASKALVGYETIFRVVQTAGTNNIASYKWTFGDGGESDVRETTHIFNTESTYVVRCEIEDEMGYTAVAEKTVKVVSEANKASVNIKVTDDELAVVPDADVVFDIAGEQKVYKTDSAGTVKITAPAGTYEIGFYKDGYLPAQKQVTMVENAEIPLNVRIVKKDIVIGTFTWKRMTYKEIKEQGIDTTDPANQNVYKFSMTVVLGNEEIKMEGHKINDNTPIKITDKDFTVEYTGGTGGYGTKYRGGVPASNTIYIFSLDEDDVVYDSSVDATPPKTALVHIQVPGEAKWLKEFFDVQLSVYNQAEEAFWLTNCQATLGELPTGLTMISQNKQVSLGTLKGQESTTANWTLRGDTRGEYDVSANFSGILGSVSKEDNEYHVWQDKNGNDRVISADFVTETPIKVYGEDGLSLVVEYENDITETDDYMFRVGLRNRSVLTRYEPSVKLDVAKSSGRVKEKEGFINYKTLINGKLETLGEEPSLKYGETVYSDYILPGVNPNDEVLRIIVEAVEGNLFDLPIEYSRVAPLTFNKRKLEVYTKNEHGEYIPASAFRAMNDSTVDFCLYVSELLPGAEEYTPSNDVDVYLNGTKIGKTDSTGKAIYEYKVPNEIGANKSLAFKGNRTDEQIIGMQIVDSGVELTGYVHDAFGNSLNGALIEVINPSDDRVLASAETANGGAFAIAKTEGIVAGKYKIRVSKNKYEPVEETVVFDAGSHVLTYNLNRIIEKPSISAAWLNNLNSVGEKVIVPEGLQSAVKLMVEASATSNNEELSYKVLVNGTENKNAIKNGRVDLSVFKEGDSISVVAVSKNGMESDPYTLPITVVKAPFVHLLNTINSEPKNGAIASKISFASLFENIPDKKGKEDYWLSGNERTQWENVFEKFATQISLKTTGDKLWTNTRIAIDWFKNKGFSVYAGYDFNTGAFVITPNYTSMSYSMRTIFDQYGKMEITDIVNNGINTGTFSLVETVDEDITRQSHYKYYALEAYNSLTWDLASMFNVRFDFDDDSWNGEVELSSDQEHRFYGTFDREMEGWENIENPDSPEYLKGVWNKAITANTSSKITLDDGANYAAPIELQYNTNTNGSWESGVARIVLKSESENKITIFPIKKLTGKTSLTGEYYVFGYRYLFDKYTHEYERAGAYLDDEDNGLPGLFSIDDDEEVMFEPIRPSLFAVETEESVFANTTVAISDSNNPTVIYQKNGNDANALSTLAIRSFNNGAWSNSSMPIDSSDDFEPSIASTNSGEVAVWSHFNSEKAGSLSDKKDQKALKELVVSQMEIKAAVKGNNGWSEPVSISKSVDNNEESCLNHSPVVVGVDGGAIAVWIENKDNAVLEQERKDALKYSVCSVDEDGNWSWSKAEYIDGVSGSISDLKIAEENGRVFLLYALTDEAKYTVNGSTEEEEKTLKKFFMATYTKGLGWAANKALDTAATPDEFAVFIRPKVDGVPQLQIVTVSGTTLCRYTASDRTKFDTISVDESLVAATEVESAQSDENTALVWLTSEGDGQKIYTMLFDKNTGKWSGKALVKEIGAEYVANNLNAFFDNNEELQVVYTTYGADSESNLTNVCLRFAQKSISSDVAVAAVALVDKSIMSGVEAKFKVTVQNLGLNDTVCDVKININGNEAVESGVQIAGGETKDVEITCNVGTLSANTQSVKVTAQAICQGDMDNGNNTAYLDIKLMDTQISKISSSKSLDGVIVKATINNCGYVDITRNIKLVCDVAGVETTLDTAENLFIPIGGSVVTEFNVPYNQISGSAMKVKAKVDFDASKEISSLCKESNEIEIGSVMKIEGNVRSLVAEQNQSNHYEYKAKALNKKSMTVELPNNSVDIDKASNININVDANTKTVTISAPGMIDRKLNIEEFKEGNKFDIGDVGLIAGDVCKDDSNVINIRDLVKMVKEFGSLSDICDFNGDDTVDITDLSVVTGNYGSSDEYYESE